MSMPELDIEEINKAVLSIARSLSFMSSGELAEVRRMGEGLGCPSFWRIASQHPVLNKKTETWIQIMRTLTFFVPKGQAEKGFSLHNKNRNLGILFCDGGNPNWMGTSPVVSEKRFARFLASRGSTKGQALQRMLRSLSRSFNQGSGMNVIELAGLFLFPNSEKGNRKLVKNYYHRLDRQLMNEEKLKGETA